MIKELRLKRFKRFEDETFTLHSDGLIICAGPNSSGKSTILHALAVWAFGVSVVQQFKGPNAVRADYRGPGVGISDDDFTPINIPDLRHLWLNLKSQIASEGYSLSIGAKWDEASSDGSDSKVERELIMAFSLVQDRLYIKAEFSNLMPTSRIPSVVYVPPVAGVDAREEFATLPKRRAMLGRGLAGAVLRNYLYDLETASKSKKEALQAERGKKRPKGPEFDAFKKIDPWNRLNQLALETFGFDLQIEPFNADFHSIIRVNVQPKKLSGRRWTNCGVSRDLMVEGSGAQQWLTVLTFALSPDTDVLLLDEPDAHLFHRLKIELFDILSELSNKDGPQIIVATHATEILKRHAVERIMDFGRAHPKFLRDDVQRSRLVSGLGDEYNSLIENARISRKILFVENESDERILRAVADNTGLQWPINLAVLPSTDNHGGRLKVFRALAHAIDGLKGYSVRDRDDQAISKIDPLTLIQTDIKLSDALFSPITWRRREIENYALTPVELIKVVGEDTARLFWERRGWGWPQLPNIESHLLDCDIKEELKILLAPLTPEDFLKQFQGDNIHADLRTVAKLICS